MTQVERLRRRILVLGGLAALLLVYIVLRPSERTAVSSTALPALFPKLQAANLVRSIELSRAAEEGLGEGASLRIERESDTTWSIASAFGYPASAEKVNGFLEEVQSARRKTLVTERTDTFGDYAGADGWTQVTVRGEGGVELASFQLGKSAGWPESYVRIQEDGTERVVRAFNLTPTKARLNLDAWVEARLWPGLTLPDITRVDVHQKEEGTTLSFRREEETAEGEGGEEEEGAEPETRTVWKMVAPKEGVAETWRVENLVRSFTGMRLRDIVRAERSPETDAECGLDEPRYRVVAFGEPPAEGEEAPKYVLEVGGTVPAEGESEEREDPEEIYVRRGHDDWIFVVSSYALGDFRAPADDFLPKPEEEEGAEESGAETPSEGEEGDEIEVPPEQATGSPDDEAAPEAPLPEKPPESPESPGE